MIQPKTKKVMNFRQVKLQKCNLLSKIEYLDVFVNCERGVRVEEAVWQHNGAYAADDDTDEDGDRDSRSAELLCSVSTTRHGR